MDIVQAIERVTQVLGDTPLAAFEADWQMQWIVERGVEIISEASRHLPAELKARHPEIPWRNVAGVGNVLRHEYGEVAATVMWRIVRERLPLLYPVCFQELADAQAREGDGPE